MEFFFLRVGHKPHCCCRAAPPTCPRRAAAEPPRVLLMPLSCPRAAPAELLLLSCPVELPLQRR